MSKTVLEALRDDIHYPVQTGHLENRLLVRGLDSETECTQDIITSDSYKGALADSLKLLLTAPNFSEADKSFSQSEKDAIIEVMNLLYSEIGEDESTVEQPKVFMGRAVYGCS